MSIEDATAATYATMRAISRACTEVSGAYMRAFDGRLSRVYIYCTLLSAKAWSRDAIGELQVYNAHSIRSLSASLKMPFETARVATKDLIARGLCETEGALVRARSGAAFSPATGEASMTVLREAANIMITLRELRNGRIPLLSACVDAVAPALGETGPREEPWVSIFLRFMVRIMEMYMATVDEPLDGLVLGTIQTMNILNYPLDRDGVLSFSDKDRRPVSVRALADKIGCPRETVRRRCNRLAELGLIRHVSRRGWIVPRSRVEQISLGPSGYPQIMIGLGRMVEDLRRTQFPFDV